MGFCLSKVYVEEYKDNENITNNLSDNLDLDYTTKKGRGYTVFAEVIDGKKTLDKIRKVRTIYKD